MTWRTVLVFWLLGGVGAASADQIELRADHWCPFNCDAGADAPGFMVEIATEALALSGHSVNYKTLSWARSLEQVRTGRIDGIIGTDEDEAPDLIRGPGIAKYREALAFRLGEAPSEISADTIAGKRLGSIKGYEYADLIRDYIKIHSKTDGLIQELSGQNALEQNLQKLLAGRIDFVAEEASVLNFTLAAMGIADRLEVFLDDEETDLFVAFAPSSSSSETYARQLAHGYSVLVQSGRVAAIRARYGLGN